MFRRALYWVPILTVAVVAAAVLVVGKPRPVTGVRVYGGPTVGAPALAWRLSVVRRAAGVEAAQDLGELTADVTLPDGTTHHWAGRSDSNGSASVSIALERPLGGAPVGLAVRSPEVPYPLAVGQVRLAPEPWKRSARQRGGWLRGRRTGELRVRAAAGQGAFAVPFEAPLWIDVRDGPSAVMGATLKVRSAGADVSWKDRSERTDAAGRAVAQLRPREHALELIVDAAKDGRAGRFEGVVPVVPGATRAVLDGDRIRIESPIVRDEVFVSLVTAGYRFGGGSVALSPDARGGARAIIDAGHHPAEPWWVVVSSERDMQSMARVGWPMHPDAGGHGPPPRTFDVADVLLLDGVALAEAREHERVRRVRWLAVVFAAAAMGLVVTLLAARVRAAQKELSEHFRAAGARDGARERMAPRGALLALIGIFCVALGFALIALLAMARW